jgi:hypothetical protein
LMEMGQRYSSNAADFSSLLSVIESKRRRCGARGWA